MPYWLLKRETFWIASRAPSDTSHDGHLGPSISKSISPGCNSSSSTLLPPAKTDERISLTVGTEAVVWFRCLNE